jgi:hypothetical protein
LVYRHLGRVIDSQVRERKEVSIFPTSLKEIGGKGGLTDD